MLVLWNLAILFIIVCGYSDLDVAIFGIDVFPMAWGWGLLIVFMGSSD